MKKYLQVVILLLTIGLPARAATNPIFNKTHILPSPYTLPAGYLIYGTSLAYGVTDFFQVGTNLLKDFYQIYNVDAKLSTIDYPYFANALTISYESFNYQNLSSSNPDLRVNSFRPGMVFAFELADPLAMFLGGSWSISQITQKRSGIRTSGYIQGIVLNSEFAWMYNFPTLDEDADVEYTPPAGSNNAFSFGASYDLVYKLWGYGISHHWSNFQLGFHFYPAASDNKVYPIISGGGGLQF